MCLRITPLVLRRWLGVGEGMLPVKYLKQCGRDMCLRITPLVLRRWLGVGEGMLPVKYLKQCGRDMCLRITTRLRTVAGGR